MSSLVTDIRTLRRLARSIPTIPAVEQKIATALVTEPKSFSTNNRSSALETTLERLLLKNPDVSLLISAFDLEPVKLTVPPGHARLWELAGEVINGNDVYTKSEIIARIQQRTAVDTERAERGFLMMIDAIAIQPTLNPDLYYLAGSTPF